MTRIYTNVPAMIARANLHQNMSTLQTSLERLSTGFKINSGKDDPAGLIASEMLRSDITGIKVAIKNTERANMMIATADSALNEVTNLLNDIRGLVTEAANTGAMSLEMIEANQLQVDASLDAIDRIAAQTTFMGQKLLDGSLDFNIAGIDRNNLKGLAVHQATFGANKAPADVVINVQEAAEKAALYYNQPALAEAIILRWGGNYGYAQETFQKGASVSQIADIINKRSDGTGVVAEVGSDALKGLLYVSSLGDDNDIIIQAGLAGLNEGNVQIKYLKGSSEGIQVKYQEPAYPGAPANILVYLQTEAYNAAFANDIDTTWVMQNGQLVPMRDNNALKFEAAIEGSKYNGASIYYVDGGLTDPRFYDARHNPTGVAGQPYAYYSDSGQSASALFGLVPGADPTMGVNGTAMAFDMTLGEYFSIQTRAVGSIYNNVNIQFVAANPGDSMLNGRAASAVYSEHGGKTLTIYYNNNGNTTLQDIQDALRVERHVDANGSVVTGAFEVRGSLSGGKTLSDVTLFARSAGTTVSSNTHNSGGAEGSLFIVLPPDGKMPQRPHIPELPGITSRAVGDGMYLAHRSPAWDNYTFEFTRLPTTSGNSVTVSYDGSRQALVITAYGEATYDDILRAMNSTWSGKPPELIGDDLYWSDASGNPVTPNVPRTLAPSTQNGVVGRSNVSLANVAGEPLYLKHDIPDFDNWMIEFVHEPNVTGKSITILSDASAKKLVVTYNANFATYSDILDALNGSWAGKPSSAPPGSTNFSWVHADGKEFVSNTPQVLSEQIEPLVGISPIGNSLRLAHNDELWNGISIQFTAGGPSNNVTANRSGTQINVTVGAGATYKQVLDALNSTRVSGQGELSWTDENGLALVDPSTGYAVNASVFDPANPFMASGGPFIKLGEAHPVGGDTRAGNNLRMINTGTIQARSTVAVGDGFFLAHDNSSWDARDITFIRGENTGGSVRVDFDGITISVRIDIDTTYEAILNALNDPNSWILASNVLPDPLPTPSTGTPFESKGSLSLGGQTITISTPTAGKDSNITIDFVNSSGGGAAGLEWHGNTLRVYLQTALPVMDPNHYQLGEFATWLENAINGTLVGANALNRPSAIPTDYEVSDKGSATILAQTPLTLAGSRTSVWWDVTPTGESLWWVNSAGSRTTPGLPTSLVSSTTSGTYRPLQYSPDGRSTLVGTTPEGKELYLQHLHESWDNLQVKFTPLAQAGGVLAVNYDVATGIVNVISGNDVTYDEILRALNNPRGIENPSAPGTWITPRWTTPSGLAIAPNLLPVVGGPNNMYDLRWVDVNGRPDTVTTLIPAATPVTAAATNPPLPIAGGMAFENDPSWDGFSIFFGSTGSTGGSVSVSISGTVITVDYDDDATYDNILSALNGASWLGDGKPSGHSNFAWTAATAGGSGATVNAGLDSTSAVFQTDPATAAFSFVHNDQKWNGYQIMFQAVSDPTAVDDPFVSKVSITASGNTLLVRYVDGTHGTPPYDIATTYDDILNALNGAWSGKPAGMGLLSSIGTEPTTNAFAPSTAVVTLARVSYEVGGNIRPNPVLNSVVEMGAIYREITANDIAAIFDMDNNASRGSERAANLFNVTTTVDNDGTGVIRLYDYWVDSQGNMIGWKDSAGRVTGSTNGTLIIAKTAFEKVFSGGSSGGNVVTTAAELVTALNNSAFWGGIMCPEMIAELAKENASGRYYDADDPPVITSRLAPGNNGYGTVSTFEEVAYYGNPNEGTALQFLGGNNSPNIRFVASGMNSPLSIDRTTGSAVVGNAQAVLTAQDSGASLTITAVRAGESYDDVLFVFKRVGEDAQGVVAPDRKDGWVEYDEGTSRAFAQATFRDATTNLMVPNTAFFITATERGELYNNVEVVMRLDDHHTAPEPIVVLFDPRANQLRITVDSMKIGQLTTNDIIAAINKANVGFQAEISFAESPLNNGEGTLDSVGLSSARFTTIANTGETGGRKGGTVTVWLADANEGPGGPSEAAVYRAPTQEDIVRLINSDPTVSRLFVARAYNTPQTNDGKAIDFVKDGPVVTSGGLVRPALITVHLATDSAGNVTTTAADLEKWWNNLDPALVDNISVSLVRPPGASWDNCDDPYGYGLLSPTIAMRSECDEWTINDIAFVGWNDNAEQQHYIAKYSTGIMTSQRGINSSYQLVARNLGPDWDGYTIEYVNDETVTGRFADNLVVGSDTNACSNDPWSGLPRDDCGNLTTPGSMTTNGLSLTFDEATKKITVNVRFGVTTAYDIQQMIESHRQTRSLFRVEQLGNGSGLIHADDNTLLTAGGARPPGALNGAKLLFGSNATDYYLIFRSMEYGADQYVDVVATAQDGGNTTFIVTDSSGKAIEKATGKDADVMVNGVRASTRGLEVSLNTSALAMTFTLSEYAGTTPGYETGFTITGGGATFQVGPDVVSRQQITMGIRSINTVMLGGPTGVLNQLRSGMDASLHPSKGNTNKAFRIVEESLLAITSIRGRLGTMQRATLETNITVLNDTLSALTEAESQIRDTDFAEETSNLTRAQILVQANMNTLGIANQIPNYMLSLLGR